MTQGLACGRDLKLTATDPETFVLRFPRIRYDVPLGFRSSNTIAHPSVLVNTYLRGVVWEENVLEVTCETMASSPTSSELQSWNHIRCPLANLLPEPATPILPVILSPGALNSSDDFAQRGGTAPGILLILGYLQPRTMSQRLSYESIMQVAVSLGLHLKRLP